VKNVLKICDVTFHCSFGKYPYFEPNIHFLLKNTLKINGSTAPFYRYSEKLLCD
jgi:hypothetical protein